MNARSMSSSLTPSPRQPYAPLAAEKQPPISTSSLGRRVRSLGQTAQQGSLSVFGRKLTRKSLVFGSAVLCVVLVLLFSSAASPFVHRPSLLSAHASSATCHPYHAFGHLVADRAVPERNRYHPFAAGCEAPELMRALRHAVGVGDSEGLRKAQKAEGAEKAEEAETVGNEESLGDTLGKKGLENIDWARGRTVLMIGDSTARNQLEQFCTFAGAKFTVHPPADASSRKRASKESSYPRACYVEKLDFLLVSVFHFGVDTEQFWRDKDQFNPPGTYEDRLAVHLIPIAQDLEALLPSRPEEGTPKRTVDLVQVSTGLWDLARFAKLDVEAGRSTITDLSRADLLWFRGRVADMVEATLKAFPGVKVVWRSMHWPSDKDAKVDWFMGWNGGDKKKHRPFFHHNRILQLEQAARSAIVPDGLGGGFESVEISEWGSILLGQHAHQMDQLHPGPLPGGWLGGDIMLYELREAVLARS